MQIFTETPAKQNRLPRADNKPKGDCPMQPERVLQWHDEYASKVAYKLKPASKGKCIGRKEMTAAR
jgi:hypothetical protein